MPDITLYKDDIESLRGVCLVLRNKLHKVGKERILTDDEYNMIAACDRLKDLLLHRLVQKLHPERPKRE